jgi:hypothetical protein
VFTFGALITCFRYLLCRAPSDENEPSTELQMMNDLEDGHTGSAAGGGRSINSRATDKDSSAYTPPRITDVTGGASVHNGNNSSNRPGPTRHNQNNRTNLLKTNSNNSSDHSSGHGKGTNESNSLDASDLQLQSLPPSQSQLGSSYLDDGNDDGSLAQYNV